MKNSKNFIILIVIVHSLIISSCSNNNTYKYIDGFSFYMKSEHDIDISNKKEIIYYVILIEGCSLCNELHRELLNNITNKSVIPILIGNPDNNHWLPVISNIENHLNILHDKECKIFRYETGISKPLLIHIQNGKCKYFMLVNDFNINKAKEYIDNHDKQL